MVRAWLNADNRFDTSMLSPEAGESTFWRIICCAQEISECKEACVFAHALFIVWDRFPCADLNFHSLTHFSSSAHRISSSTTGLAR